MAGTPKTTGLPDLIFRVVRLNYFAEAGWVPNAGQNAGPWRKRWILQYDYQLAGKGGYAGRNAGGTDRTMKRQRDNGQFREIRKALVNYL